MLKTKTAVSPAREMETEVPHEYEVKDAAECLMRAEEIKKNQKLMPHVHKHLGKKVKQIRSIQDIRDAAKEMSQREED